MTQTSYNGADDQFECPHCGALYTVTVHRFQSRDQDWAICQCCHRTMKERNDTAVPTYTLMSRPANENLQ